MATNLNEFYKEKGQALPSLTERSGVAKEAGITGYVGSAAQNAQLLGYLQNTPNKGNNNVITSESLNTETPIVVPPAKATDTSGVTTATNALVNTTKSDIARDQAEYDRQQAELAATIKAGGDTSAFEEQVYKDQGVDEARRARDKALSLIEQEQLDTVERLQRTRTDYRGTTAGAGSELERIQRDSATNIAKYGIGLAAISRDYEAASNIANRLIEQNSNKIRADIESRKFIFEQLGTKLATEKANALTLELRALDRQDKYYDTAIQTAINGAADGTIDQTAAFSAVQKLTAGEISISQFYSELGVTDNTLGNINGYDITSYATDPTHELKVQSIYDTLGEVTDAETAEKKIKERVPNSPITGVMVMNAAQQYNVDPALMIAIMAQDSSLGTAGKGARTKNPGNVGNDDAGNEVTYNTWEEGVGAVAKWLNGHRSKGVYRGEFQDVLQTVADAAKGVPEVTRKRNLEQMKRYVADGNYAALYTNIENQVNNALEGDVKSQFAAKRLAIPAINDLEQTLKEYEAAGGNTGLLKGTYEQIYNKLGAVADPKFKALAADLRISLQQYRKNLSGAAFSEQEAADYESVNASGNNSLDLNLALIQGMRDNFQRSVDTTVDTIAGDGAQYIREYARTGTQPAGSPKAPTFSTPNGNSFTIIEDEVSYGGGQTTDTVANNDTKTTTPISAFAPKPMDWGAIMAQFG